MNRLLDSTEKVLVSLVSLMLIFIVGVTLIQVFFRYMLNDALVWTEEMTKLIFIWMTYLGSVVALNRSRHMRIDSIVRLLPPRAQIIIDILMHLLVAGFLIVLTSESITVVQRTATTMTSALRLPRSLLFLPVAIGGGFMILYCIRVICQRFVTLRSVSKTARDQTG